MLPAIGDINTHFGNTIYTGPDGDPAFDPAENFLLTRVIATRALVTSNAETVAITDSMAALQAKIGQLGTDATQFCLLDVMTAFLNMFNGKIKAFDNTHAITIVIPRGNIPAGTPPIFSSLSALYTALDNSTYSNL